MTSDVFRLPGLVGVERRGDSIWIGASSGPATESVNPDCLAAEAAGVATAGHAGAADIELARQRYLAMVWRLARPPPLRAATPWAMSH